jgi:hypothetical protein
MAHGSYDHSRFAFCTALTLMTGRRTGTTPEICAIIQRRRRPSATRYRYLAMPDHRVHQSVSAQT